MAVQTTPPAGRAPRVTSFGITARPAAGSTSWETFSWYFFRISGVGLIFLALIHVFLNHIANDVSATSYDYIAARYANPFWRVYDLLLLTLALLHGLNGLRIVCDDYIKARFTRLVVQSGLFLVAVTFWLMGTMTIITFQPGHTLAQTLLGLLQH
jgi:succinate dehydrogenase / fumarate reductase membrane anchor subunit